MDFDDELELMEEDYVFDGWREGQEYYDSVYGSSVIPDCCLGCPNHPMNGGSATCAYCEYAVNNEPPEA